MIAWYSCLHDAKIAYNTNMNGPFRSLLIDKFKLEKRSSWYSDFVSNWNLPLS